MGAGTGAYEPSDKDVVALEPSSVMVAQRPVDSAPVVRGVAGALPFADNSFDGVMALLTTHHWPDQQAGYAELRRVARKRIVLHTWDPDMKGSFWLAKDYLPQIIERDMPRFPPMADVCAALGQGPFTQTHVIPVPIPHDCTDGFLGAFWRRPEAYLLPETIRGISTLREMDPAALQPALNKLRADLASGAWQEKYGDLLDKTELDLGYRLAVASSG